MSRPIVTGTYTAGQTLTCSDGDLGFTPVTITKRWFLGATTYGTGDTYVVQPADLSHQIYCEVKHTDQYGYTMYALSDLFPLDFFTDPGAPAAPPCYSSTPSEATFSDVIHDTAGPGPVADISAVHVSLDAACALTLSLGFAGRTNPEALTFAVDVDGNHATGDEYGRDVSLHLINWGDEPPYATISHWLPARHQWANGETEYPVQAWSVNQVSMTLPVTGVGVIPGANANVSASNSGGEGYDYAPDDFWRAFPFTIDYSSTPPSAPAPPATGVAPVSHPVVVAKAHAPKAVKAPKLSGHARVGSRLKCSAGSWNGAVKLIYAWKRNGRTIRAEKRSSYTVRHGDRGRRISCTVTASNAGGRASMSTRRIRVN